MTQHMRWPAAPLLEFIAARLGPVDDLSAAGVGASTRNTAELLGVDMRAVTRWRGGMDLKDATADHCATRLGVHPTAIWPDWCDFDELTLDVYAQRRRYRDNAREARLARQAS